VKLGKRHPVQTEHANAKRAHPGYISRDFQVAGTSGESISIGRW
jgi:hypothetical protein